MGARQIPVTLTEEQYKVLIAAFTEYDVVLSELYEDESIHVQRVQTFVRVCRKITRDRWEPPMCVKALDRPDFRGRMKKYR